jgi:sterol desaturase/sphingolipid hydroxylase (fatty acid hydroxylase superfamily)
MNYPNKALPPSDKSSAKEIGVLLITLGVLALTVAIILWPFAVIWSINLLFSQHIPYTFATWLATLILSWTIAGPARVSSFKKD